MFPEPKNPLPYERYRTETIRDLVYFNYGGIVMQKEQTVSGIARRIKWADIMRIHFPPIIETPPSAFFHRERNDADLRRPVDVSEPDVSVGHS
jgi:hypothetical protein